MQVASLLREGLQVIVFLHSANQLYRWSVIEPTDPPFQKLVIFFPAFVCLNTILTDRSKFVWLRRLFPRWHTSILPSRRWTKLFPAVLTEWMEDFPRLLLAGLASFHVLSNRARGLPCNYHALYIRCNGSRATFKRFRSEVFVRVFSLVPAAPTPKRGR